jgi:hypothetical protein
MLDELETLDDTLGGLISIPLPFRRTPANIIREGIRTSPLGFLATGSQTVGGLVGTVPRTPEEMIDAYAQATVGTLGFLSLVGLATSGVIQGNPTHFENNRAKRTTYFANGQLPETMFVNVGGRTMSVPLTRLQPIGGLVIGAMRTAETMSNPEFEGIGPQLAFQAMADTVFALGFQDAVEGTSDFLAAAVSDDPVSTYAERFGGSFVPAIIRQSRQAAGLPQGRAEKDQGPLTTFSQGFASGLANTGLPKLGLFGEPSTRPVGVGAFGIGEVGRDPVVQALIDAGSFHQAPDLIPELKEATAGQKHLFIRGKGQLQKKFVAQVVQRPNFAGLPQDRQKRLIDAAFVRASELANRRGRNAARAGAVITPQLILSGKLGL